MRSLFAVALLVAALPSAARAELACPTGLVPVDATHCCWPGQAFNPERQSCAGAPTCPAGLAPYGETCVMAQALVPPPPDPIAPTSPPPRIPHAPTRFEVREAGDYVVTLEDGTSCRAPCELALPLGRNKLVLDAGGTKLTQTLKVKAETPLALELHQRKKGRYVLGVAGVAVGGAGVVGGAAVLMGAAIIQGGITAIANLFGGHASVHLDDGLVLGSGIAIATGAAVAGVCGGIGFGTMGSNGLKPVKAEKPSASVGLVGVGLAPTRGGAVAGATFTF